MKTGMDRLETILEGEKRSFDLVSSKAKYSMAEAPASLHRHGCAAAKREAADSRGNIFTFEAESLNQAIDISFVESGLEQAGGWDKSDIKVHNCIRR